MKFKISRHLQKIAKKNLSVKKQFIPSRAENNIENKTFLDPIQEDKYTPLKGLIHKFENRVLILLTLNCAAYCRFCTRRWQVLTKKNMLLPEDIENIFKYIKKHKKITEIIISGGDPLTNPKLLKIVLQKISKLPQLKIIRLSTRLPISDPKKINHKIINILKIIKNKPLYLMLHFEHPAEITAETIRAIKKLQPVCTAMFSQSVFLKGINDNVKTLKKLFTRLLEIGIKPYYIFRCDYVKGNEHFIVDIKKEIKIMTELRKKLTGLAYPLYIIDTPNGFGKIPVPLNFWQFKHNSCRDFQNKKIII